jgi:hypothetical protein
MLENSGEKLQEKAYTVKEVATKLRKSPDWVRREFRHYAGVIYSGNPKPGKRRYTTLLIPAPVFEFWIREHTVSIPPDSITQ